MNGGSCMIHFDIIISNERDWALILGFSTVLRVPPVPIYFHQSTFLTAKTSFCIIGQMSLKATHSSASP